MNAYYKISLRNFTLACKGIILSLLISGCSEINLAGILFPTPTIVMEAAAESTAEPLESATAAPEKQRATIIEGIPYASKSPVQILDLYIPAGEGPFPLVVIIHGGGFMSGGKRGNNERARARLLLGHGYAAASINYRLSDEAIYPAQIQDTKTAVRFLRANAQKYKLDSGHFGAWGSSAGGTLSALLGTTCGVEQLEGTQMGNKQQSSCINAVVDWFGLVDLLSMDEQFQGTNCPGGHDLPDSAESRLVGAPIQTVPDLVAKTNPMNYLSPDDAAFFIQHGSKDCRVPPVQSQMLAEALVEMIGEDNVFYEQIEGAGHGGKQFTTDANYLKVIEFFDRYLK